MTQSMKKLIHKYHKNAEKYFHTFRIIPDKDDIVNFVADQVMGFYDVTELSDKQMDEIEKELGYTTGGDE